MLEPGLLMAVRADIDRWERPVAWMYLDSLGNVTVGAGLKLATPGQAGQLPFHHEGSGKSASPGEIGKVWKTLNTGAQKQKSAALSKKFSADHYSNDSDLRIDQTFFDGYRDQHINADYYELKKIYRSFDDFPENAKRALFDMIYNLGAGRIASGHHPASGLRRFSAMNAAIDAGRWEVAAKLSLRHGIPAERNRWTADLFRSCATQMAGR